MFWLMQKNNLRKYVGLKAKVNLHQIYENERVQERRV